MEKQQQVENETIENVKQAWSQPVLEVLSVESDTQFNTGMASDGGNGNNSGS